MELQADTTALLLAAGVPESDLAVERSADMRLAGQLHEINVPLPAGPITEAALPEVLEAFKRTYSSRFTSVYGGASVQAIRFAFAPPGRHQRWR